MRIGVLTLHDSVNYGATLQAFALCAHLRTLGHQAFVLDRRRAGVAIGVRHPEIPDERFRIGGIVSFDAHNGAAACRLRVARTASFLRENVKLSKYAFTDWKDAPADLGADVVIVGSDQVWNANNLDPANYLMTRAPQNVPCLSYAASVGMTELPETLRPLYQTGLRHFTAVSVREREAADLLAQIGVRAEHVVDPVLLAGPEAWNSILSQPIRDRHDICAYFLAEDFPQLFAPLGAYARSRGSRTAFFTDWYNLGSCRNLHGVLRNARRWRTWRKMGVDVCLDAGPADFLRTLSSADTLITNSYHGLMFAILFDKQVRVVLPTHPVRRAMNARLTESANAFLSGPVIHETLDSALHSLATGAVVNVRRSAVVDRVCASRQWLVDALKLVPMKAP